MQFVKEDADFGMMKWRLLSREPDTKTEIFVLPLTGIGAYLRTVVDGEREEPVLIKNAVILEIITREDGAGLVDASGQDAKEPKFKCLNRELISLELAKKRYAPKGKSVNPGLEIVAGALITSEQMPQRMVQPAAGAPPAEILKAVTEARA